MTAATQDILTFTSGDEGQALPALKSFPVDANKTIYAGTMVGISASGWAGPADGATYTVVVGICQKQVVGTATAGEVQVSVRRGSFGHLAQTGTTIDKTKINQKVYAVDDSTLSLTATSNAFAGYVEQVLDSVVYYDIGVFPT